MKQIFSYALCSFLTFSAPSFGGMQDDLDYIVTEMFFSAGFTSEVEHMTTTMVNRLSPALAGVGGEILDEEAVRQAMTSPWLEDYRSRTIKAHREAFEAYLTPDEIAEIAAFLPTETGQAFLSLSPQNPPSSCFLDTLRDGPLLAFFEHKRDIDKHTYPALYELRADLHRQFRLGAMADLVADPALIGFEDESQRDKVVTSLRALQ